MNKLSVIALLGASAMGLTACGGGGTTTNTTTTTTTTNTVAPAPAAPAGGGNMASGGSDSEAGGTAGAEQGSGTARQDFTLVNHTGHTVITLNVSPSDSNQWGEDILGRDTLANGETAQVTFPREAAQCNWDIRATYDDNDTTDQRGVNLCQVATVELTAG